MFREPFYYYIFVTGKTISWPPYLPYSFAPRIGVKCSLLHKYFSKRKPFLYGIAVRVYFFCVLTSGGKLFKVCITSDDGESTLRAKAAVSRGQCEPGASSHSGKSLPSCALKTAWRLIQAGSYTPRYAASKLRRLPTVIRDAYAGMAQGIVEK